ncbi:hypothetical protein SAMN04487916_12035 [Arthrobacter sp. ov407]|nr:hypothetical protein SAMN04487916_12035 [Arthrobacter sp. ov407]
MKRSAEPVFLLLHTHVHPDLFAGRSTSFIGVFCSEAKASNSLRSHALLEGFKDCPEGFAIHRIELDSLLADPIEMWE